jgi:hypothetical protein
VAVDQTNFSRFRRTLSLISTVGFAIFTIQRDTLFSSPIGWPHLSPRHLPQSGAAVAASFRLSYDELTRLGFIENRHG